MHPLILIGAGLAGWTTVREFRKLDITTPIVLVTADSGDFYAKPSLSNAFAQKRTPDQLVSTPAAKMVETLNVTLMAQTQVLALDTAAKTITVHTPATAHAPASSATLVYSQLVLATGAQPIRVPLAGNAAAQVQSVNSLEDFSSFHSVLKAHGTCGGSSENESKTVVIMGAGLIGCEFANDLVQAGHQVHVVDPMARPLAALLPAAAGEQVQAALCAVGVQWHLGATVQSVVMASPGAPLCITLSDGNRLQAHAVLSAIGLGANTALASAAGIACERGIVVDHHLQTSASAVFALGDCAQYASANRRTLPYVMPIMNAARALAATLTGNATALVFPLMPVTVKTPALPTVVASPTPGAPGGWVAEEALESGGAWRFLDSSNTQMGFVLTGKQTARRMEFAKATVV